MKALVYLGLEHVEVQDFNEPPFGDNTVKIKVHYCGLCGTDIHKYHGKGGSRPVIPPIPLGHEISGEVVEIGSNVKSFKIGDRVVVDPNWSCGKCYYCRNGMKHMCSHSKGVVKGFAEYVCPPEENVYHIPDKLSLKHASLAEPLSCCIHGIDQANIHYGDSVLIIGLGAIGLMMIELAKKEGATNIIAVEPIKEKKGLAFSLGATHFISPSQDIKSFLSNHHIKNIDCVLECVGLSDTIESAFELAGKCATVVLFGVGNPLTPAKFNQFDAFQKELTIKTSFINPGCMQRAIDCLEAGFIHCDEIISKVTSLEGIKKELEHPFYSKSGKVLAKI